MSRKILKPKIKLRNPDEIQKAHDILVAVLLDEVPDIVLAPEVEAHMSVACDVLCWVLMHDNEAFAKNITSLEKSIEKVGKFINMGFPQRPGRKHS